MKYGVQRARAHDRDVTISGGDDRESGSIRLFFLTTI